MPSRSALAVAAITFCFVLAVVYAVLHSLDYLGVLLTNTMAWFSSHSDGLKVNLVAALIASIAAVTAGVLGRRLLVPLRYLLQDEDARRAAADRNDEEMLYLDNLIAKVQREEPKWHTSLYVPLEVLENYTRFQMDMVMVTHHVRPHIQAPEGEEVDDLHLRGRRTDLMGLLKRSDRLVVLGEPGSGKTVSMRQLVLLAAAEARKKTNYQRRIPVFVRLTSYTKMLNGTADSPVQPVLPFLREYIRQELPSYGEFLAMDLEDYLKRGRLIIIFDGLNQLPASTYTARLDALKAFAQLWPRAKFIYTCRTFHYDPNFSTQEVEILPLTPKKIEQFAHNYLGPHGARAFMSALDNADRRILQDCRIPYFLALAINLFAVDGDLPRTRAQLFSRFTTLMVENVRGLPADQGILADRVFQALHSLALAMNDAKLLGSEVSPAWVTQNVHNPDDAALAMAAYAGLLDQSHDGRLRFAHHILQEYFAAASLLPRLSSSPEDIFAHVGDPWWSETIALLAGLDPEPERLIRLILSKRLRTVDDLRLAARCIASSTLTAEAPAYRETLEALRTSLGQNNPYVQVRALQALRDLPDAVAAEIAASRLRSKSAWVQEVAFRTLADSPSPAARQALVRFFRRSAPWSRLVRLLQSPNSSEYRRDAIIAVGQRVAPIMLWWSVASVLGWEMAAYARSTPSFLPNWALPAFSVFQPAIRVIVNVYTLIWLPVMMIWLIMGTTISRLVTPFFLASLAFVLPAELYRIAIGEASFNDLVLVTWSTSFVALILPVFAGQGWRAAYAILARHGRYRSLHREWTFSAMGFLLCAHLALPAGALVYVVAHAPHALADLLFVLSLTDIDLLVRLLLAGGALFGAIFLLAPLPADLISVWAQTKGWRTVAKLRRIERGTYAGSGFFDLPDALRNAETWARDQDTPESIRGRAIVLWSRNVPPIQAVPLLFHLSRDLRTPPAIVATAQRAIDEIYDRWRRQSHPDTHENSIVDWLLAYATDIGEITAEGIAALLAWASEPPNSEEKKTVRAMLLWRQGKQADAQALLGTRQLVTVDGVLMTPEGADRAPGTSSVDHRVPPAAASKLRARLVFVGHRLDQWVSNWLVWGSARAVLVFRPSNAWAIRGRGEWHWVAGRYGEALADFNRALEIEPDNALALAYRGQVYCAMGRYDEALADSDRALDTDPNSAFALRSRGETYRLMERYEEALADFNRALQIEPDQAFALVHRGQVYRAMGRHDESLADFNRALQIEPDDVFALVPRGQVYCAMGRYDEALADFNRALEIEPGAAQILSGRGEVYRKMRRYDAAVADLTHAIEAEPANPYRHSGLAIVYLNMGEIERAREEHLERIRLKAEDALMSNVHLAVISWHQGDAARATTYAASALAVYEEARRRQLQPFADLLEERALALLFLDRGDEAIETLKDALARPIIAPDFDWRWLRLLADAPAPLCGLDAFLEIYRQAGVLPAEPTKQPAEPGGESSAEGPASCVQPTDAGLT